MILIFNIKSHFNYFSQLAGDGPTMTNEEDLRSFLNQQQQQQQQSNSSLSDSSRQHFTVIIPPHRFRSFSLPSGSCWRNNNIIIGEQINSNNSNHSRRQSAVYNQQVINLREFREGTSSNMSYPNPNLSSPQPRPACPSIGSSLPYTEGIHFVNYNYFVASFLQGSCKLFHFCNAMSNCIAIISFLKGINNFQFIFQL